MRAASVMMRLAACRGWLGRLGLVALAAALLNLAGPKLNLWPLALLALVPALFAVANRSGWSALGWGWTLGLLTNAVGQVWAVGTLHRFGELSWAWSILAWLVIAAYQGCVFGVWAWATRGLAAGTRLPPAFAAAASLVAAELVIPFLLPWGLGLLLVPCWPATQIAELCGAAGLTFLLALVSAQLFEVVRARVDAQPVPWRSCGWTLAVVAVALGFGLQRGVAINRAAVRAPKLRVGLVQPNFGIVSRRLRSEQMEQMIETLRRASAEAERQGAELVIWSESAWPTPIYRHLGGDYPPRHPWQLRRGLGVPLLAGVLMLDAREGQPQSLTNAAWLLDRSGNGAGLYEKNHLFPLAEYVPFGDRWPDWQAGVRRRMSSADQFRAGEQPVVLELGRARLAPLICYEDILPHHVRRFAPLRPNLLVTLANVSWFGASAAPEQQLHLAALRAIEQRHELVRATATGVSGHVDALGRIRARGPLIDPPPGGFAPPRVMVVEAALVDRGLTVYARVGDRFGYLCLGFVVVGLLAAGLRWPRWLARPRSPRA